MPEERKRKKDFPEEEDLAICTVDRISGTSVFLKLDEYGKEGVMNFSEVAPGRIRNIRDYITINKKIVCKVLRADKEKSYIELSLRRVNSKDQKELLNRYNREKSNVFLIKRINKDEKIIEKIKEKFDDVSHFFEEFVKDNEVAKDFFNKEQTQELQNLIQEKEKAKKVRVNLKLHLEHGGSDGIKIIKEILIENRGKSEINYISAPNYSITLEGNEYKEANKKIREIAEKIVQELVKKGGKAQIIEAKK